MMKKILSAAAILGLTSANAASVNFCQMENDHTNGVQLFRYCINNKAVALLKVPVSQNAWENNWNMGTVNLNLPCKCFKNSANNAEFIGKITK